MHPFALLLCCLIVIAPVHSWQRWTHPAVDQYGQHVVGDPNAQITSIWPGPRDGHSFVLMGDHTLLMFGGRANELVVPHIPKTFDVQKVNGSLQFTTYDEKLVYPCENRTASECYDIPVGRFYNDVWAYSLHCPRNGDGPCYQNPPFPAFSSSVTGWAQIEPGSSFGGCTVIKEEEICTHPHERFGHMSAAFPDGSFLLYGGFSRMCEDYCSDLWVMNATSCILATPSTRRTACIWRKLGQFNRNLPGKRWRAASAHDDSRWLVFGGYRLWHGFAQVNTLSNRWMNYDKYERGGYMDDMWIFDYSGQASLDAAAASPTGGWRQVLPMETCHLPPTTLDYEATMDVVCTVRWPKGRAGAAMTMSNNSLWLHGGYGTPFPHPTLYGRGAGEGTRVLDSDSLTPFPTLTYYMQDLWRYDFHTGIWRELRPLKRAAPLPRMGHSLLLSGSTLILYGGAYHSHFLDEMWLFDTERNMWHKKVEHFHPLFPANCTSDVVTINGTELVVNMSVYGEPTRFTKLDGLEGRSKVPVLIKQPRRRSPGWDGCRDRVDGRADLPQELQYIRPLQRGWHGAAFSKLYNTMLIYGGEANPREEPFQLDYTPPSHTVGDFWSFNLNSCIGNCSGHGECFMGACRCFEGWYGRDCSNVTCPGAICDFDYERLETVCVQCVSLPYVHWKNKLLVDPQVNRGEAYRLIFSQETQEGGKYAPSTLPRDEYLFFAKKVRADWISLAYSDARTRYILDEYEGGVLLTWNASLEAASRSQHGICDGFGQCQCAPPFLGDDCSILDCPKGCSGRGWCSVEYPVSRCMCDPPWAGPECSITACPNNCSYPNGVCNSAGKCACTSMLNPYNRSQIFMQYGGDDCSYQMPFAGSELTTLSNFVLMVAVLVLGALAFT